MLLRFIPATRTAAGVGRACFHATGRVSLKAGVVGLPNVGKSTLFNALTRSAGAEAANFPFCTIDPNVGLVLVPDPRLVELVDFHSSEKSIPSHFELVDIAGIVAGASEGAGLGNKFLANIREVDAIVHVVRCFEDRDVIHVSSDVNPLEDMAVINLELVLADLQVVQKRLERVNKDLKRNIGGKDKKLLVDEKGALDKIEACLDIGKPARFAILTEEEEASVKHIGLLSRKKMLYAANVGDTDLAEGNALSSLVQKQAKEEHAKCVIVSANVEQEMLELNNEEELEFLDMLGVQESGCHTLIRQTFDLLGLQTYFTAGPQEVRAWTIHKGHTAPRAASVIHTDLEKGFIQADVISCETLLQCKNEKEAVEKGLIRKEGKTYVVQEGDVIFFRSGLATKR